ncbi:hypothetical protein AAW31_04215 [Nitrosomonas communis]|uniref:Uncharacterized protein n=1 Tax=Nitrosomonas communis TaxID=44574 RepID=A0A0F7KDF7_9PROT|nr:hypothetical protein AAW31_04215 [Nitrosomonas communis]
MFIYFAYWKALAVLANNASARMFLCVLLQPDLPVKQNFMGRGVLNLPCVNQTEEQPNKPWLSFIEILIILDLALFASI